MNKNIKLPTNKNFGIVFSIVFLIIALFPLINSESLRIWSLIISAVFLFLGLINSKILTPLNNIWFKFGLILGRIVSPVIMGVVFFLVVTPTAFIMRLVGKDLLNLKFNKHKSYWIEKNGPKSNMKNQF
tara:strand:- start:362 stop:748 length:387 start_codon:yes stop_codon:yes gene_type:complete